MTKDKLIKDLESQYEKLDKLLPTYDSTINLLNKCTVILINDTEQIFNGIINQQAIRKSEELEKNEQDFLIFMLETLMDSEGTLVTMPDPLHSMEEGILDSNGPHPKEITIGPSKTHIAHFDYYSGISYTRAKNLKQTTSVKEVCEGNHFMVMCGDVLVMVNKDDFPKIPRRNLVD
jgi:exonuclease VII small subunit